MLKVYFLLFKKLYQFLLMVVQLFSMDQICQSKVLRAASVYSATKAAVRSFARCWTVDLKERKIRVNCLSPGPTDTPMLKSIGGTKEASEQILKSMAASSIMGRLGHPSEIAKAALFLASDDSSYITGIELFVDGGLSQILKSFEKLD